jgi:type IV pilus assembly protein PilX
MNGIASSSRSILHPARGVTLIFALITLAVLALASVGLMRSVDTSARILGNLGIKHDALRSSDSAAETAIKWIQDNPAALLADGAGGTGYFATAADALDPTGTHASNTSRALVDWPGKPCTSATSGTFTGGCLTPKALPDGPNGIKSSYVITRLCTAAGSPADTGNNCAVPVISSAAMSPVRGEVSYAENLRASGTAGQYYRILVRTEGARNAIAFTETIVHF